MSTNIQEITMVERKTQGDLVIWNNFQWLHYSNNFGKISFKTIDLLFHTFYQDLFTTEKPCNIDPDIENLNFYSD